jgi:hypothetical protein
MSSVITSVSKVNTRTLQILGDVHQWKRSVSVYCIFFMMNFYYPRMCYSYFLYRFYANWQHTILTFTQGNA